MDLGEWQLQNEDWVKEEAEEADWRVKTEPSRDIRSGVWELPVEEEENWEEEESSKNVHQNSKDKCGILDTKGHCFLCLMKLSSSMPRKGFSMSSLQCLSSFLRLDQSRTLLRRSNSVELKGSLCSECTSINDKFVEACIQLEKIKLKVSGCLKLVRWKLLEPDEAGQQEFNSKKNNNGGGGGNMNDLEVVEELRKQAGEKCSLELTDLLPRTTGGGAVEEAEAMYFQPDLTYSSPNMRKPQRNPIITPPAKTYNCDLCPKIFSKSKNLRKHQKAVHLKTSSYNKKCLRCGKEFFSPVEERAHRNVHAILQCGKCGSIFQDEVTLAQHQQLSNCEATELILSCRFCWLGFSQLDQFLKHLKKVHKEEAKKGWKYECDICSRRFEAADDILNHREAMHGLMEAIEPIQVDFPEPERIINVDPGLEAKGGDLSEVKVTSVDDPVTGHHHHKCIACDKTFQSKFNLEDHFNEAHLNLVKFKCRQCGEELINRTAYLAHYRSAHLKGVKWVCRICHKNFHSRKQLRLHGKVGYCLEGETSKFGNNSQACSCRKCQKNFDTFRGFRRHWKDAHMNKTAEPEGEPTSI